MNISVNINITTGGSAPPRLLGVRVYYINNTVKRFFCNGGAPVPLAAAFTFSARSL